MAEASRKALVTGVANDYSIAWGVAQALSQEGYELCLTYPDERIGQGVKKLAAGLPNAFTLPLNVSNDEDFTRLRDELNTRWPDGLHALVHAIAFAQKNELGGEFSNTTREGFRVSLDVSCFSFIALTGALLPMLEKTKGCSVSMSYLGGQRVVPNYNVMGVAKAALEMSMKYLAAEVGRKGVRVNVISPGPIRTLAARGIHGFTDMLNLFVERSPLGRPIKIEEVGQLTAFICSDKAAGITGQVIFVDGGCEVLAF